MSTSHRTALVTGGNRGLGAAIARALHDVGHRVIVTHTPGNTTIDQWQQAQAVRGYTFAAYGVDVSEYESTQELAWRIRAATPETVAWEVLQTCIFKLDLLQKSART